MKTKYKLDDREIATITAALVLYNNLVVKNTTKKLKNILTKPLTSRKIKSTRSIAKGDNIYEPLASDEISSLLEHLSVKKETELSSYLVTTYKDDGKVKTGYEYFHNSQEYQAVNYAQKFEEKEDENRVALVYKVSGTLDHNDPVFMKDRR